MKKYLLIIVFCLAFILRFWQLGNNPPALYQDETAIGYNAYSILQTGKDEYGKSFPLYFKSFGDWKLPVYIYSTIIPIKLFGLNSFSVRFPSALAGFLTVIVFYFYLKNLTKDENLPLAAAFLLTINPWHLHYSRATFEVSLCLLFFLCGAFFLHLFFEREKKFGLVLASLFFLLALYSYNLTRLLAPVFLVMFLIFYRQKLKKISLPNLVLTSVISLLFLLPFLLTFFSGGGVSSARGTLFFSSGTIQAPILEFRSYLVNLPVIFNRLFFNQIVLNFWQYLVNFVSYFSVNFFFISGSLHGNHGIGNFGQFYLLELSLMIAGLINLAGQVRQKMRWPVIFFFWSLLTIAVAALTREVPHATRSFFLIVPLEIFSAVGLINLWKQKNKIFLLGFVCLSLFNVIFYFASYYLRFPVFYAKAWRTADKDVSFYLKDNESKYEKIIFDSREGFMYTSLLFYLPFDPIEFERTIKREPDDNEGFSIVKSFGKYEFKEVDWGKDYENKKNVLIVTTPDLKPANVPPLKTFYYPRRPVVLSLKEKIFQYPIEEIAYVLVETP